MNCPEFTKICFAHADGELGGIEAAHAEAHLASCARCAALVEADRMLKASLARGFARDEMPPGFSLRAFTSVKQRTGRHNLWARRVIPIGLISAMAACVALWVGYPMIQGEQTTPAGIAKLLEDRHLSCAGTASDHHNKNLPRDDLAALRRIMSASLALDVLAPDLRPKGLEFHSADYCGLTEDPGAHLLYHDKRQLLVSVLTVHCMKTDFARCSEVHPVVHGGRTYDAVAGARTSSVAWHEEEATYVICAELGRDELLRLADPLRVALELSDHPSHAEKAEETLQLAGMGWNVPSASPTY